MLLMVCWLTPGTLPMLLRLGRDSGGRLLMAEGMKSAAVTEGSRPVTVSGPASRLGGRASPASFSKEECREVVEWPS